MDKNPRVFTRRGCTPSRFFVRNFPFSLNPLYGLRPKPRRTCGVSTRCDLHMASRVGRGAERRVGYKYFLASATLTLLILISWTLCWRVRTFHISPKPSMEIQSLVFVHVPKCGGSSVRQMLLDDMTELSWGSNMSRLTSCNRVQDDSLQTHQTYWANTFLGATFSSLDFAKCPYHLRSKIRFLTGHIPYGACEFLKQPCKYVTVLREPRSRLISEVKWIQLKTASLQNYSVSEFIELSVVPSSPTQRFCKLLDNHQTRLLSGDSFQSIFYGHTDAPCDQLTSSNFELALQHLNGPETVAVGLLAHLAVFRSKIRTKLNLQDTVFSTVIPRENVNPTVADENLSIEAERIIDRFTRFDMRLYRIWETRFLENSFGN